MNIELEKQDIGLFIVFMQISKGGVIFIRNLREWMSFSETSKS